MNKLKTLSILIYCFVFALSSGTQCAEQEEEKWDELRKDIKKLDTMTVLNISVESIEDMDAKSITEALKSDTKSPSLNLSHNNINGVIEAKSISEALQSNTTINSLN